MPEKMSERRKRMKRPRHSSEESDDSSSFESSSLTSSSSDEEIDVKDLKPIKEYLSDRKELASQLFKSVKTEKICMMLPQILKKVDVSDLEELCANELTGMSKRRIMSIINGQEMLESSNTDESDDSGPSLEIISDTEWLSEDEIGIKVEGGSSKNKDAKKLKKKSQNQKKQESKPKLKGKVGKDGKPNVKVKLEKVKTEKKEKEKQKEKEGESLLDLLELEMRARAIRALIRKEEDASNPNVNSNNEKTNNSVSEASGSGASSDQNVKARQANLKEQLEKIDVLMKHGDDEDVFVVIQPAPTIELLSSDSENEEHSKRVNQRLVSERVSESEKVQEKEQSNEDLNKEKETIKEKEKTNEKEVSKEKDVSKDKGKGEKSKIVEKENENFNLPISVTEDDIETHDKPEDANEQPKEVELEEGEIVDNDDEVASEENKEKLSDSPSRRKIKKVKRNSHIRSRKMSKESSDGNTKSNDDETSEKKVSNSDNERSKNKEEKISNSADEPIEIEESPKRKGNTEEEVTLKETKVDDSSKIDLDDDKALDIEEIINLDDYPDDMDDLERNDTNKDNKEDNRPTNSNEKEKDKAEASTSLPHSETWATRYYQQDDVQNVIRESKIQSEIRKRLRERQRQSKLNNSPKLKEQMSEPTTESEIPKPTGSVEEYLALKGLSSETSNDAAGSSKSSSKDSNSAVAVNDDSSSSNDNRVEAPAVIVKKAKLNENAVVVKKIEAQDVIDEHLNKVLKCEDLLTGSISDRGAIVIKEDSILTNKKVVIVKESEKFTEDIKQAELSNLQKNISPLIADESSLHVQTTIEKADEWSGEKTEQVLSRDDVDTPKSDSSEDNIIIKIGDTSSTTDTLNKTVDQEVSKQIEETVTSELRQE